MNRLPAQLALEVWTLRPYSRQFILLPVMGLLLGFMQDSFVPIMVTMGVLTGSYGFSISENARLETLYATLPISRRQVVVARYAVAVGTLVGLGLLGVVFDGAAAIVRRQDWAPVDSLILLAASLAVAGLVIAVQFPFFFALGYLRARFVTWLAIALVIASVTLLMMPASPGGAGAIASVAQLGPGWPLAGLLIVLLALAGSVVTSIRVYAHKDL